MKRRSRSKISSRRDADTMLPEYDFSRGVRGKTWRRYAAGANVVVLDPDNAKAFPDSVAVNEALRVFARFAGRTGLKDAERASEARWSKALRRSAQQLAKLAAAAKKEHQNRRTRPLNPDAM